MNYLEVIPVMMSTIDIPTLTKLLRKDLTIDIRRKLDDDCVPKGSLLESQYALALSTQSPRYVASHIHNTNILDMLYCGFCVTSDEQTSILLAQTPGATVQSRMADRYTCVTIVVASWRIWFQFTLRYCTTDAEPYQRDIASTILRILSSAGLKNIWAQYQQTEVQDGYILTRRE